MKNNKDLDNLSLAYIFQYILIKDLPNINSLNYFHLRDKNGKISILNRKISLLKYLIKRIKKNTG